MTGKSEELLRAFLREHPHEDIADIGGLLTELTDIERTVYNFPGIDICLRPLPLTHRTIISMDTFEHILDPIAASKNIIASLQNGGFLFLTTVFSWPYHCYPIDTYRYSSTALAYLFRDLSIIRCWMEDDGGHTRTSIIATTRNWSVLP